MSDATSVSISMYQIKIHTLPGDGHFEASLQYNIDEKQFSIKEKDISRINKYGSQANCVYKDHAEIRKYCYCKTG